MERDILHALSAEAWASQPAAHGGRRIKVLDNGTSQQIQILLGLLSASPHSLVAMLNDGWEVRSALRPLACFGYAVLTMECSCCFACTRRS